MIYKNNKKVIGVYTNCKNILFEEYPESHKIYYTTNDGNIVNVHNYWFQPIINEYDKGKDLGVMIFDHELTEIPGVEYHPFLYDQNNLLTLKLPKSVTKLGRGCFYGCSNLYQCNVEDLVLKELGYGCFEGTSIKKLDFRNSKFTSLGIGALIFFGNNGANPIVDCVLLPSTIEDVESRLFAYPDYTNTNTKIKTLMIPTLTKSGNYYIENTILENLIINKFDGLGDLHHFNGDVKIWVPDEFYDGYIEKYTNYVPDQYLSKESCEDIISRMRKYSEGVPEFPEYKEVKKVKKIYKGEKLYWEINSGGYNPKKLYITGKFTNDSTSSDWFVYNGSSSSSNKVNISEFVDPETKEFDVVLNDVKPPYLFYNNKKIERIDSSFIPTDTTSLYNCFNGCSGLTQLNVADWKTDNVTTLYNCFSGCSRLTSLDVSSWNVENVSNFQSCFGNCRGLTFLDLSTWKTDSATSLYNCFDYCSNLTKIDVTNWNVENVTNLNYCFDYCSKLTSLDLSTWKIVKVTSLSGCFYFCRELTILKLGEWDLNNVTSFSNLFSNCSKLTDVTGVISNIKYSISIKNSPLTNQSAMVFINGLSSEITSTQTITFNATTYDTLTEEQIALATSKGWSVVK